MIRSLMLFLLLCVLSACNNARTPQSNTCAVTEPAWLKPAEDAALNDPPAFGYYYVNEDQSIWASAYADKDHPLHAGKDGNKMGWFRSAGAALAVAGRRLDGDAPPLEADFPCCYPTRFQASGLYFPTAGCWEVTAQAADSKLIFTVWVEP